MKTLAALAATVLTMLALATTAGAATAPDGRWGGVVEPSGFRWSIVEQIGRWGGRPAPELRVRRMAIGRY